MQHCCGSIIGCGGGGGIIIIIGGGGGHGFIQPGSIAGMQQLVVGSGYGNGKG